MKKLLTISGLFLSLLVSAQGSPDYGGGLKFNLNPEGTKYMRFIAWNQVWLRSTDLNPGSMIGDESVSSHEDAGLRRLRLLAYAQISPRYMILTHIGINNQTFINGGGDWGSGQITNGDFIPSITPHLLSLSAGAENSKWDVLVSANYVGNTRVKPGQDPMIFAQSNENYASVSAIRAFATIDCSINMHLNKKWGLYTSIQNMANNHRIS